MRRPTASRFPFALVFVAALAAAPNALQAQEDIVIGKRITIFSRILNEERTVRVGKPSDYDRSDDRYPVMIVLDGETHFDYTIALTRYLAFNEHAPNLLVVAIENTQRTRDMTPPVQDPEFAAQGPHGGAEDFRSFIGEELIPWVEDHYRTRPYRILVGHSFGGLFAIDTLISRPELFNAYIAISPGLLWDRQRTTDRAEAFFDKTPELKADLFMTVGNEGGAAMRSIRRFAGVLDEKAPMGLEWHFEHLPAESHYSVPLPSTYQGLEFIFADWELRNPLEIYNRYGIEAIERFYAASDEKYGYSRGMPESTFQNIAGSLMQAARIDEVYDLLVRYRDTFQAPLRGLVTLASAFRERGDIDRAIELYRQALEINPNSERVRQALAELGIGF